MARNLPVGRGGRCEVDRAVELDRVEQLESALDAYEGTLLLVTHDRQLLAAVELDRTIELSATPA